MVQQHETAVFAGGCFWCTEAIFERLKGVASVESGYAGGEVQAPSYEQVSGGKTGHAESVRVEYDSDIISYNDLLDVFFGMHDPTTPNRQGADVGEQYRSMILYANDQQKELAEKKIRELSESGEYKKPIVTEVKKLGEFYKADEHHQDYYEKGPHKPYCQVVINPKLEKLQKKFSKFVKE